MSDWKDWTNEELKRFIHVFGSLEDAVTEMKVQTRLSEIIDTVYKLGDILKDLPHEVMIKIREKMLDILVEREKTNDSVESQDNT